MKTNSASPSLPGLSMSGWNQQRYGRKGPSWSVSRDQQLQVCERKFYYQYLAGARVNASDSMQRRLGVLKKMKSIRMWQGDCLHWAIARFLGTIRNTYSLAGEDVLAELREKMEREWTFSEQKRFWDQPTQIDKGGLALVEHEYSSVPSGTTLNSIFKSVAAATSLFVIWAESPGGIVAKIKVADNVWIEPPVFGDGAP